MVDMYRLISEVRYTNVYVSAHEIMVLVAQSSNERLGKTVKYRDLLDPSRSHTQHILCEDALH